MQEQVNKIEEVANITAKDVKEIKDALLGNDFMDTGLIERVKTIEDYQNKDQKQKYMVLGAITLLTFIKGFWKEIANFLHITS